MKKIYSCTTCFYSQDTVRENNIVRRDRRGCESKSSGLTVEFCICFADPIPRLVCEQIIDGKIPDIRIEPTYHKCGRGRWWKDGKWVKWVDLDDLNY